MANPLFDIFGDHLTRQATKNVSRQPLDNIENMGKIISSGPLKPNEPVKKGDAPTMKKSFLSNAGKALQSTPARGVFTPRAVNVGSLIYSDAEPDNKDFSTDDLQFTKPSYKYNNYNRDLLDYLPLPEPAILKQQSPPTPPPATKQITMEFDCSYQDEFFLDDFSNGSFPDDDLGLPELY